MERLDGRRWMTYIARERGRVRPERSGAALLEDTVCDLGAGGTYFWPGRKDELWGLWGAELWVAAWPRLLLSCAQPHCTPGPAAGHRGGVPEGLARCLGQACGSSRNVI